MKKAIATILGLIVVIFVTILTISLFSRAGDTGSDIADVGDQNVKVLGDALDKAAGGIK